MIEISEESARAVIRLLDDIIDVQSRARCSDAFFRSHFMDIIKAGNATGAFTDLRTAYEKAVNKPTVQTAKPVKRANKAK